MYRLFEPNHIKANPDGIGFFFGWWRVADFYDYIMLSDQLQRIVHEKFLVKHCTFMFFIFFIIKCFHIIANS